MADIYFTAWKGSGNGAHAVIGVTPEERWKKIAAAVPADGLPEAFSSEKELRCAAARGAGIPANTAESIAAYGGAPVRFGRLKAYEAPFRLKDSVSDREAAQKYLSEDDMSEYLCGDDGDGRAGNIGKIVGVFWALDGYSSGKVVLLTSGILTEDECRTAGEWIRGQCSDGLGEGFEQQDFACYDAAGDGEDGEEWAEAGFDWETNEYVPVPAV